MKKNVLFFVLGLIVAGSISGVVAYQMSANQITYIPKDNNWNVHSVKDAIDDLKTNRDEDLKIMIYSDEINGSSYETSAFINMATFSRYKKVKIDKIVSERNSSSCSARAWEIKESKYIDLTENTEYEIINDEHELGTIELLARNTPHGRCRMDLIFSK